jgi:hypothetical protein
MRFMVAYPALVGFGFILGLLALGRLRTMTNGRRALYQALASAAFALAWAGVWGVLGVWQYGLVTDEALHVSRSVVSLGFTSAVLWIAVSLGAITLCVLREEFHFSRAKKTLSAGNPSPVP